MQINGHQINQHEVGKDVFLHVVRWLTVKPLWDILYTKSTQVQKWQNIFRDEKSTEDCWIRRYYLWSKKSLIHKSLEAVNILQYTDCVFCFFPLDLFWRHLWMQIWRDFSYLPSLILFHTEVLQTGSGAFHGVTADICFIFKTEKWNITYNNKIL